jgi:hypothetical protein
VNYAYADEVDVEVNATTDRLFDHLDDQTKLAIHMEKPSVMMMGGRMTYEFDETKGRAVGSVIKMGGSFLGIKLSVEEVVTERDPPRCKVWETRGRPHILIIGSYRMGFETTSVGLRTRLRVFIEYGYPRAIAGRILGGLLAPIFDRWCVKRMARGRCAPIQVGAIRSPANELSASWRGQLIGEPNPWRCISPSVICGEFCSAPPRWSSRRQPRRSPN